VGEAIDPTKRDIQNLRALIAELRPAALDELGLGPAIETLASRGGSAAGLSVSTRVSLGDRERLEPETESTIYRVVQEALTNAAKHAGAERVSVTVERDNGTVEVLIEDDGHGFDTTAPTAGLGLLGMRERVELTGGRLEIRSQPGTRVRARLPVSELLRRSRSRAPCDDEVTRVSFPRGASAPGRRPRRTKSVGAGAAFAISERVGPSPSCLHRSDRPITSSPAADAASTIPSRPCSATIGSAEMPAYCWTSSDASPSSRVTRDGSSPSAAAPSIRSGAPV
jgi:two-component sensor histidine kinase